MDPYSLKKLNQYRRSRQAAILVTDLGDGRDRVVIESDVIAGELGQAIEQAFSSGKSAMVETGAGIFFLNVHLPPPRLIIIGAVHISQALAPMAAIAGFDVHVIDPRTAFASPERFHGIRLDAEWPELVLDKVPLDPFCAVAAVTHDPKIDDFPIMAALRAGCFYVGALGSRKTHAKRIDRLTGEGISEDLLSKIKAPIGLPIRAAGPAEIAVAVLAEIIQALRSRGMN